MKKLLLILFVSVFLVSCGPKRMSCYGKRCVEVKVKPQQKLKTNV